MIKTIKEIISNQIFELIKKRAIQNEGLLIYSNDTMGAYIIWEGVAEKKLLDIIIRNLNFDPKKYSCLDVGANIGNHSVFFSKYFNKVISFEPQKEVFEVLKLNTSKKNNIVINNFGLSEFDQKNVIIKVPKTKRGMGSTSFNLNDFDYYEEKIDLKNYDSLNNKEISLIKIDVEGSELNVIKGMVKSIKTYKPIICFEYNPFEGGNKRNNSIINVLEKLDYNEFYVMNTHISNKLIKGKSPIFRLIRLILKLVLPDPKNELIKFDKSSTIGHNLIIAFSNKSNFRLFK